MNKATEPVDAAARKAALDITQSFIVQAPAGSGKTGLLTQRYLALLAHAEQPEEIVAITFTLKAAGEMRARIVASLQRAADDVPPEAPHERLTWELARAALQQDRRHDWGLRDNPGRLRVQTIDSLCASLTRQMPLLSTFGSQPSIADDASFLYGEAARRTLADIEAGEAWSPHVEHLLRHLDNDLQRVERLLSEMLQRRDHWLRYLADRKDERLQRSALEQVLQHIIEEHLHAVGNSVPSGLADELVALASISAGKLQEQGADSPIHACLNLKHLPGHRVGHLPVWQGIAQLLLTEQGNWRKTVNVSQGFPPEDKQRKGECPNAENKRRMLQLLAQLQSHDLFREQLASLASLPAPGYTEAQWDILQALIELLPMSVAHLHLVFRSHGLVDFTEIAQKAVLALGTDEQPTDLALALDYRIHHILVDEFQDTSLSQYQLLVRMTVGWENEPGRSLFLVGDPMQSIYRFREAEVALYLRARQHGIGSVPLTALTLSVNFRSRSPLIAWFNSAFSEIFPGDENPTTGAVGYAPSHAGEPGNGATAVQVYPSLTDDRTAEARRVTELVKALRDEDEHQHIAILVRARTHLDLIVAALNDAGIGYRAVEIERLANRQPVIDLVSLTRALMHPADRIAWIAILRAPWLGLTLTEIEQILGDQREAPVWQRLQPETRLPDLADGSRQRLQRFIAVMSRAMANREQVALDQWVEDTWLALAGPATLESPRDLSDGEQYFRLLRKMITDGKPITVGSLHRELEKLYASTDSSADERLQIMTIHKAKGLEFDAVILPALGRRPPSSDTQLVNWAERATGHHRDELIIAPISASGDECDKINEYLRYLDRLREQNESVRLLYVAATRAKRSLHLLGHTTLKQDQAQPPTSSSLLARLWPAVRPAFEQYHETQTEQTANTGPLHVTRLEVQGIRRLSDHWQMPPGLDAQAASDGADRAPVEYSWVGPSARHIGTAVHRALEYIVRHGAGTWRSADRHRVRSNLCNELITLGVPAIEIDAAAETVIEAVDNALADERGKWVLDNRHRDSRCEYGLISRGEHGPATLIIDRTFIDADGVRWIIDYKTSRHSGGGLEEFLDREQQRYQPQLEAYARLLRQLEHRPIQLGLYFPLLSGWRAWAYPE